MRSDSGRTAATTLREMNERGENHGTESGKDSVVAGCLTTGREGKMGPSASVGRLWHSPLKELRKRG